MTTDKIVSFDDEKLIVVDEQDSVLEYRIKTECHQGEGILHRHSECCTGSIVCYADCVGQIGSSKDWIGRGRFCD